MGRRAAQSFLALVAWVAGCEALIDGSLRDIRCQDEGAVGPPACPAGDVCRSGVCAPSELGQPCTSDADCAYGDLCLDPLRYGGEGPPRCSRTCCASTDCDPDPRFVCWMSPIGNGSFCRAGADVGRTEGGEGRVGAPCVSAGDCRSGICSTGLCADTCCGDTSCAAGDLACQLGAPPPGEGSGFWCGPRPVEKKARYAICETHGECASGLCIPLGSAGKKRCTVPCCGSAACEILPDEGLPVACAPVKVDDAWVRACSQIVTGAAAGEVGSACAVDGDCRSGACVPWAGQSRCADSCCSDAACGDPATVVCRPAGEASSWALRCGPK